LPIPDAPAVTSATRDEFNEIPPLLYIYGLTMG